MTEKTMVQKLQKNVLVQMNEYFKEDRIAATLDTVEDGLVTDVLSALYPHFSEADLEVLAEFYFLPQEAKEQEVMYFVASLTLQEDIPQERITEVSAGAAMVDALLATGGFMVDREHRTLIYRLAVPILASLSYEKVLTEVDAIIQNARNAAMRHSGNLMKLVQAEISVDDYITKITSIA